MTLTGLVFSTPTLGLDSGRKCTQHFALQKDVAVKVSGGDRVVENVPFMGLILLTTDD